MERPVLQRINSVKDYYKLNDKKFAEAINVSQTTFSNIINRESDIKHSVLEKISNAFGDISVEWLLTGEGEMFKKSSEDLPASVKEETKPRIPYDAAAGMLSDAMSGLTCADCEQIPVIQSFSKYDYSILVKGDSMEGELKSGDEVFCKDVTTSGFLRWGDIHVLNTSQGVVVKRVYDDGEYILCKSELSEVFKDFRIPKSEIYNIGLVIGVIRRY